MLKNSVLNIPIWSSQQSYLKWKRTTLMFTVFMFLLKHVGRLILCMGIMNLKKSKKLPEIVEKDEFAVVGDSVWTG